MALTGLPDTYRFAIFNQTGIGLSDVPTGRPRASGKRVRYDVNGALSYEATEFTFFSYATAAIATGSYCVGSTLTNTSLQYLAIDGLFSCFASGGASGNVYLFLEESPDGGTTWPTPASANGPGGGLILATIGYANITTNSTASTVQRIYWTYP